LQEYLEKLEKSGFRIRRTKLLKRELIFSYHLVVAEAG
jgi:hypothetical protein